VVICLERGANDLHMLQLMLLSPYHLFPVVVVVVAVAVAVVVVVVVREVS